MKVLDFVCFSTEKNIVFLVEKGWNAKRQGVYRFCETLPVPLLFDFNFFLHVYLFAVRVVEDILQKCEFLVGNHFDTKSVLHLPLPLHGHEALVDVGGYVRVDV